MSIRDKDGKMAITPGEWKYATTDKGRPKTVDKNKFAICTANAQPYNHSDFELCAEAGTVANRYDATPAEMVETIRELREALDGICEQAQDHPAFLPACFDDRDFDTIEQVGGDSADWTLIAIMADDALCKTAKYEETK